MITTLYSDGKCSPSKHEIDSISQHIAILILNQNLCLNLEKFQEYKVFYAFLQCDCRLREKNSNVIPPEEKKGGV